MKTSKFSSIQILVIAAVLLGIQPALAQHYLVQIHTENHNDLRFYLEQRGYDVAGYNRNTGELGVVVQDVESLDQLQRKLEKNNLLSFYITSVTKSQPYKEHTRALGIPDYYDYERTVEELKKIETQYPQWAKLFNLNEWLGVSPTEEGRNIYALQVSTNPGQIEEEPKVMLIGVHHAREITTHHAVIDAAIDLLNGAAQKNPRYVSWIENTAVWFVPVANPDGLDYVFNVDNMWRKNRSNNPDGSRGVDLNRNYEFKWGACGGNSNIGSSDIYKGPSPHSEPEVQLMDRLNARLKCQYIISYHSYGDEVLYPYVCGNLAEGDMYYMIRDALAARINFGIRYASSSGEDFEHHYNRHGTISFLLEIGSWFQPSFQTYKDELWPVLQKVLPFILEEVHQPYVYLKVTDSVTGEPIPASLSLDKIIFQEGEKRTADEFGAYWWRLLPGNYNLTVSMEQYKTGSIQFIAGSQTAQYNVELEKISK